MKLAIAVFFCAIFLPSVGFSQCVDFSGKYENPDTVSPIQYEVITQKSCDEFSLQWILRDGTVSEIGKIITDGKLRRWSYPSGDYFMSVYTQTAQSFKAVEIHGSPSCIYYDNNTAVKLSNGDMQVTNELNDCDSSIKTTVTTWILIP